jgi:hypothetical protein
MRSRLSRFRPSPAVVISAIAVFFAIGGIGYAASKIGTNRIKDHAVTDKKLHGNSVGSGKVKDHSLKRRDLGFTVHNGPPGPQGPQGPQGPAGPPGAGQGFERVLGPDAVGTVGAGTTTLNAPASHNGVCQRAYIHLTEDVYYQVFRFSSNQSGPGWSGSAEGTLAEQSFNNTNLGINGITVTLNGETEGMWKVIASPEDGSGGVSVYEFTLDTEHVPGDGTGCYFQGEALG